MVRRCCQVREVDAGVADGIGSAVMDAHLTGRPAVAQFVAALDAQTVDGTFQVDASPSSVTEAAIDPYRNGVEVDEVLWAQLHAVAEAFLVSAELLDGFDEQ